MADIYNTMLKSFKNHNTDAILMANEFLDDEGIYELLQNADDDTWNYIYENREKYDHTIRVMIEPYDYLPMPDKVKMRLLEMTDEDMDRLERERLVEKKKEFDSYWETIKHTIPERPCDQLDDELDDAWDKLSKAKLRMTVYLDKKKTKYVPPSARKMVDPEQQEIEDDIDAYKKLFDDIEKRISEADDKYVADRKNECFEEWLFKL